VPKINKPPELDGKAKLSAPWKASWEQAWQAYCDETVPIGAVIVDSTGKILAKGRNRTFGKPPKDSRQIHNNPLAHAEINALLTLDFDEIDPYSCSLYTTVEPCPLCIGAICMSKIKEIHYGARDPWGGSTNLLQATPYLRKRRIKAFGLDNIEFETAILSLQIDFSLRYMPERFQKVVDKWMGLYPEITLKAIGVYESDLFPNMMDRELSSEEILFELFKFIANDSY
jgi:tRNA(adenine34) deaminase